MRDRLAAEEDSFDVIDGELTGVKPKDIHPLFTWIREHSAMHDHVEKFGDEATRDRGCTPEFSRAKVKKEGLVPRTQPKLGAQAEPLPIFPPMINRRFFIRPPQRKSTPVILLSPHY